MINILIVLSCFVLAFDAMAQDSLIIDRPRRQPQGYFSIEAGGGGMSIMRGTQFPGGFTIGLGVASVDKRADAKYLFASSSSIDNLKRSYSAFRLMLSQRAKYGALVGGVGIGIGYQQITSSRGLLSDRNNSVFYPLGAEIGLEFLTRSFTAEFVWNVSSLRPHYMILFNFRWLIRWDRLGSDA